MHVIVAGPYIGELGFEIGDWVPHLASIRDKYDSMVVFARNGHKDLYPFADKFMGFNFGLESRHCDKNWMMKPSIEELLRYNILETQVKKYSKLVQGSGHKVSLYLSDSKIRRGSFTEKSPIVLNGSESKVVEWEQKLPTGPKVLFVVRLYVRGASKNSNKDLLDKIVSGLKDRIDVNCILVGHEELSFQCMAREKCTDLLDKTTIDDLIAIYSMSNVVIGASTGTIHLAAACGIPHITWVDWVGDLPVIKDRYYTSWNLNKTPIKYLDSEELNPEKIINSILTFLK